MVTAFAPQLGVPSKSLLDPQSRMLLESGLFPELRARDASLYLSLSQLSPQERQALVGYLQLQVPLTEFDQVA